MDFPEDTWAPPTELVAALERVVRLVRRLSPSTGMSLTAVGTLSTLDRVGPHRLTELALTEAVSQPAMTQLIARLADAGLVERVADPGDRRVVVVRITQAGKDELAYRRSIRTERLTELLEDLDPRHQQALHAAAPAIVALSELAGVPS
ncbi:MarR family winged helix-turn-helix transcriptional regulator [Tenggerimyces flavus]|uniref:MarR family winged helix-turn-helix transcriptional regulator n=1 Tax=Tenggerimyces flavus TaxID=1708749 RepID=A0ABV7YKN6_9ACTN|nr:MarR family transcriptional regulator [Tenggerimyces flavus]MBM7784920.1 DNA-binding MarR family transcriptional regulator [Tenggerimyces flavus]